ncbi:MAG: formylglycine-generating enzyme family protein [Neomegalonema sp.]|nr:formylglycine-generating enzyme family protein [Neomegalonema sp.]
MRNSKDSARFWRLRPITRLVAALTGLLACAMPGLAQQDASNATAKAAPSISWATRFFDPAAGAHGPADLIVPLPCGGAIAFQRVNVPAQPDRPLDDMQIRLGSPQEGRAPLEYLHRGFLRGAFADSAAGATHYFIGRYEVTAGQYRAVMRGAQDPGACKRPGFDDLEPATSLSWFDAVAFTRAMTEWLLAHAPEALPKSEQTSGFVRLPTEIEWEFAARGGAQVDAAAFNAARFFGDGESLRDYGWHQGRLSSQGEIQLVGLLKPNPLGLFDLYGNAEEMTIELFSLNKFGRSHGQRGGFAARGGHFNALEQTIGSAARSEYGFYDASGSGALALRTLGMRVVLSAPVQSSDALITRIEADWREGVAPSAAEDPLGLLNRMIENETEAPRKARLQALQALVVADRQAREDALALALRRTIFSGASILRELARAQIDEARALEAFSLRQGNLERLRASLSQETPGSEMADFFEAQIAKSEERLPELEKRLALIARAIAFDRANFLATLTSVQDSSSKTSLAAESARLIDELAQSGQQYLVPQIRQLVEIVERYRLDPQMERGQILDLIDATRPE